MKKMQEEHKHVVTSYEDRINQLMANISGIRNMADILEVKQANAQGDTAGDAIGRLTFPHVFTITLVIPITRLQVNIC